MDTKATVQTCPAKAKPTKPQLQPNRGAYKEGDDPAKFGGAWADDGRTLHSVRERAWPKRG